MPEEELFYEIIEEGLDLPAVCRKASLKKHFPPSRGYPARFLSPRDRVMERNGWKISAYLRDWGRGKEERLIDLKV